MKRTLIRFFSLFLSVVMLLAALPAFMAFGDTEDGAPVIVVDAITPACAPT